MTIRSISTAAYWTVVKFAILTWFSSFFLFTNMLRIDHEDEIWDNGKRWYKIHTSLSLSAFDKFRMRNSSVLSKYVYMCINEYMYMLKHTYIKTRTNVHCFTFHKEADRINSNTKICSFKKLNAWATVAYNLFFTPQFSLRNPIYSPMLNEMFSIRKCIWPWEK